MKDGLKIRGHIRVEKYATGVVPEKGKPCEVIECENLFLTTGSNEIWELVIGGSANHYNNGAAQIGIGEDKATAPAAAQTDLQGSSKTYKGMDATFPNTSGGSMALKATFGSSDANYEWGEFVVKNAVSAICLNRSTNSGAGWGTKTVGTTWVVTATLSIA